MIALALPGAGGRHGTDPVAQVGKRTITMREISCELMSDDLDAIAANQHRDRDILCLEREQLRLDSLIAEELHDVAINKLAITVSKEDLADDSVFHHYGEAEFVRLAEQYGRLGRAALLVYSGEDLHTVYAREIHVSAIQSKEQFRHFVALMQSGDGAKRFIEYQTPEHFRDQITSDARRRVARDKLMRFLSEAAGKSDLTYEAYSEKFWRDLAAQVGLEILDTRYRLMSLKGLSWQPKQLNTR